MTHHTTTVRRNRGLLAVLAVGLMVAALAAPTSSVGAVDDEQGRVTGRIIGGSIAPAGTWPEVAALLRASIASSSQGQFCGSTILNHSWILTAAHCVQRDDGSIRLPSEIDVLTGTQDLAVGGTRLNVATVRPHPKWSMYTFENDVALLRLDDPTPSTQFIGLPPASTDPNTDAIPSSGPTDAAGWGAISTDGQTYPDDLYQVGLGVVSDGHCQSVFPASSPTGEVFYKASMMCAGPPATEGKDTCFGDSGGPLVAPGGSAGNRIQWGITSWGAFAPDDPLCAIPGKPGVYSRVPAFVTWINSNTRYGPHASSTDFVTRVWLDLYGRTPTASELSEQVASIKAQSVQSWVSKRILGATWQNQAATAARLYKAAFTRDADTAGLGFWINQIRSGWSLKRVAEFFATSDEFEARYGLLDNESFVEQLYQNVLGRPGEPAGVAYWTNQLDTGAMTRGLVLRNFAQSAEFVAQTKPSTDVTVTFFGLLRRVPTAGEHTTWVGQPNVSLTEFLVYGFPYADRF